MLKQKAAACALILLFVGCVKWLSTPPTPYSYKAFMRDCVNAVEPESIEELTAAYDYCGEAAGATAD